LALVFGIVSKLVPSQVYFPDFKHVGKIQKVPDVHRLTAKEFNLLNLAFCQAERSQCDVFDLSQRAQGIENLGGAL
jgi:hypothetical protein